MPHEAYEYLSQLTDSQDVPATIALSLLCELLDNSLLSHDRKSMIIHAVEQQLIERNTTQMNRCVAPGS